MLPASPHNRMLTNDQLAQRGRLRGVKAIADALQLAPSTIKRHIAAGHLPVERPGGTIVEAEGAALAAWRRGAPPPPSPAGAK